jgi:ribosomal-protein-alanine N-acetyltransferase
MTEGHERVELHTERLTLRPFELDDVDDTFAFASDPVWAKYLPIRPNWPQPFTRRDAEEFVARQVLTNWETTPMFAIVLGTTVVGWIKLNVERQHEIASVSYALGKDHWGKGLVPEAATALIDWGFAELGLARMYAGAEGGNTQSQRVMEKVGMSREAVLRSHHIGREGRVDQVLFGILRQEWEENRRRR